MRGRRTATRLTLGLVFAVIAFVARAQSPPYAAELERLSEILGSLQFLSELCDSPPAPWRDEMQALIDLTDAPMRARLTDRFNVGYASFAAVYRQCTAAARIAIDVYREEGAAIAADIAARYGTALPAPTPSATGPGG